MPLCVMPLCPVQDAAAGVSLDLAVLLLGGWLWPWVGLTVMILGLTQAAPDSWTSRRDAVHHSSLHLPCHLTACAKGVLQNWSFSEFLPPLNQVPGIQCLL